MQKYYKATKGSIVIEFNSRDAMLLIDTSEFTTIYPLIIELIPNANFNYVLTKDYKAFFIISNFNAKKLKRKLEHNGYEVTYKLE